VTETDDVREAWVGLAAARLRLGEAVKAAAALARALSCHALLPGCDALADQVAAAVAAPGWCGLATGGRLRIGAPADAATELRLDGREVSPRDVVGAASAARCLSVRIGGREALGSPISLAAIRGMEGAVACRDGGLEGWAWHPADPDREPVVHVTAASGRRLTIAASSDDHTVPGIRVLARTRRFVVSASSLKRLSGPYAVSASDGTPLPGSPLDPRAAAVPQSLPGSAPSASRRRRPVDVVIQVEGGLEPTLACLDGVLAHIPRGTRIMVIDDAAPEPVLSHALDRLAVRRRISLLRHSAKRGSAASADAGLRSSPGRDVVLLSGDILVAPGWLDRLRNAAYAASDIGSVTPLSNAASLAGYPAPAGTNLAVDAAEAGRLDRLAQRANGAATADIPTGAAFCVYLRRDCLDAAGPMRADGFAHGDGAVADLSLRARRLGWRHVVATGVFVGHAGDPTSGQGRRFLRTGDQAVLNRLHPGWEALVGAWTEAGGLAAPRRRLDEVRWREARPRGRAAGRAVLLITHDRGGGVERHLAARCAALAEAGDRPVLLRPARTAAGAPAASFGGVARGAYPNLIYALPSELRVLAARLRAERPVRVELHHLLGHHPAVLQLLAMLGVPYDVHVHDYAWFCPRVVLLGPLGRYCGEPEPDACETCVAEAGRVIEEDIPVQALIDRSAALLRAAGRVIVPSRDAAARMRRHFPTLRARIEPHENEARLSAPVAVEPAATCRVLTIGAIGIQKGFDVLFECARDAASRRLPLEFVVVGHTIDDARLMNTGRVFVTGEFAASEAQALIRAQQPTLALLPSVWPETWCFALTEMWQAGLHVAAFDLGAQAERIRASGGRGTLLPLGLSAPAINNALLAAAGTPGHQGIV
jgi:glycosyltransferase involved in cell wall biosynthesis